MVIKDECCAVFLGFSLVLCEAGGNRPQPCAECARREPLPAHRLGHSALRRALWASHRTSCFYWFLSKEHIRSPRREIGYDCGVSRGKEGVAPASALAAYGGDEMCLRFAGIKTDKNNLRLVKPCRVCRRASRRAKSVRFCSPLIPAATAVSKRPLHRPQEKKPLKTRETLW